jgi:hypothetical protein
MRIALREIPTKPPFNGNNESLFWKWAGVVW